MNKSITLSQITTSIFDGKHGDCENLKGSGLYFISVKDLSDYNINYYNAREITPNDFEQNYKRTNLEEGDTIYANTGDTIGKSIFVKNNKLVSKTSFQKSIAVLKPNINIIEPRYLYYLMKYETPRLRKVATGSGQKNLLLSTMRDFKVTIHDRKRQKQICSLLGLLDDKIEINNKINDELENMAKTIYDYWFLQFEFPNEEGKPYKSSGGKMVWNEELKREIPEGWEVIALKNNIQIIKGISYTSKNINAYEGIPMINLASINIKREYNPNQLKYFRGSYNINKEVSAFDMLIACTDLTRNAEIIGSPILVPNDNKKYIYSMDLAKIEVINSKIIPLYLYMTLRTDFFHKYIKGFASGTNVLHLDTRGIEYYKIYIPDKKLQRKFADILHNIHCKQSNIMKENQELTSLRDFLLPLLMNGQVGFKENKAEG
ncbi:MAG: restriction endonuclease subunit S [Megamonas funiformis]|uniref:restriction endonuclease subunit S n=1 Tax=Megamonas funiformis TaxID=437897 RepID=UPI002A81BCC4|nr:restriction endonuclease subunit S [Megamonas funiformis]MDY3874306.1 restriction endonuclease subunit S [Megamonas funiformis]